MLATQCRKVVRCSSKPKTSTSTRTTLRPTRRRNWAATSCSPSAIAAWGWTRRHGHTRLSRSLPRSREARVRESGLQPSTGSLSKATGGFGFIARWGRGRHSKSTSHRSEEHTSELQSLRHLVCRLLLEKKKKRLTHYTYYILTASSVLHHSLQRPF